MYIFKNAFLNITRSIGRNMLIGLIITVVTISSFIAITINKSGTALVNNYKKNNPLTVSFTLDTMSFRNASDETKEAFELIDIDFIDQVGKLDIVNGYYYTLQSSLNSDAIESVDYEELFKKPSETETEETTDDQMKMPSGGRGMMMSSGDFTVIAYSDISYNEEFINGDKKIIEGSMIAKDNTENSIVISEELATENEKNIGDTITFINTNDETITYDLTVVGIYEVVSEANSSGMMMGSSSNQIYTNLTILNQILSDDGTQTKTYSMSNSISSSFYIDYEDLEEFENSVKELGLSDYYQIKTNESEILATLEPIQNIASFSLTFLFIILIVGGAVLVIVNLFNIRERKYEIGVLRAIGMTKSKVTLQLVLEILMIALCSLIIGISIGTVLSQPVSNYMLSNEIENMNNTSNEISNNFGGENFERPGFGNRSNSESSNQNNGPQGNKGISGQTVEYVTTLEVSTDFTTILQLFGVELLLTMASGCVAVMFVNKYEPNKILQNRG